MRIVLHDLEKEAFQKLNFKLEKDDIVLSAVDTPKNCIGCFGCWTKTPGKCVLKDDFQNMGTNLAQASQMIIISECVYGGYSPKLKSVIDRSIPFLLPFFRTKKHETHHKNRYRNKFEVNVLFYGENLSLEEKESAKNIVAANQKNFFFSNYDVTFASSAEELKHQCNAKGVCA